MSDFHNFRTVLKFEIKRTLLSRRFWIATAMIPLLFVIVFVIEAASNSSITSSSSTSRPTISGTFEYVDNSGIITPAIALPSGGQRIHSVRQGIDDVRSGRVSLFFVVPPNPEASPVALYGQDVTLYDDLTYNTFVTQIIQQSAIERLDSPELTHFASTPPTYVTTYFKQGHVAPGLSQIVLPGIFIILQFFFSVLLAPMMLAGTLEEKENRLIEMLLTCVRSRTLLIAKMTSIIVAALVQILVIISPLVVGYFLVKHSLHFSSIDLSKLVVNPVKLLIAGGLLVCGLLVSSSLMAAIGAIMPSAKDAARFTSVAILGSFLPFYAIGLIISNPDSMFVKILSYFPLTAPLTAIIRNTAGSLSIGSALFIISELLLVGLIILRSAIVLFESGAMAYSQRVSLRAVLFRR